MTGQSLTIEDVVRPASLAKQISLQWSTLHNQRAGWMAEKQELRNFIFATDTQSTSGSTLPWKNSTTLPKLCQIRDNLHSNYIAAAFPNDDWLQWEAYTADDNDAAKRTAIQAYMSNKVREGNSRNTISKLLYDYIDYGNCFADVEFVNETKVDEQTLEIVPGFIGPRIKRISPHDIVFNPTAAEFEGSYKIVRSLRTLGDLAADAEDKPEEAMLQEALEQASETRRRMTGIDTADFDKMAAYTVDGFGSLREYYDSGYVEILRFEGDIWDNAKGALHRNRRITIIDRAYVLSNEPLPSWTVGSTIRHVGWRLRPDNLYAMGPLDNLVGMQYRIDHLENLKADVFDMIAAPPIKIIGEVEPFTWGPNAEIHIDMGGDVQTMAPDTQALNADFQIRELETRMEEFAGAPKQAMGVRTPGEKTAFEVQSLQNAAGRIFQEKITNFEINLLEPILNDMLEISKRHLDTTDVVRVMDDDLGVAEFLSITRADITAKGKLRPVGARHFSAQAQLVQNLNSMMNGAIGQTIAPHISAKKLAKMMESALNLERFDLIQPNIAIYEQQETQEIINQTQEDVAVNQATDIEEVGDV
tara:strand:- start:28 stop:1788 length:1761 start_codon:yes stop_codon:yes gene_type:complete